MLVYQRVTINFIIPAPSNPQQPIQQPYAKRTSKIYHLLV